MACAETLHRRMRDALDDLGVRPRKRLGQNFLVASAVVDRIVDLAGVEGRTVVEIGPGIGALSDRLTQVAKELFLVEIDPRMAERLRARYAANPAVHVTTGDAMEADFASLVGGRTGVVAVGNLPYSVGTQILLRLIEARATFDRVVLMLQREVAERIVAGPGTKAYGVLSLWTALYGEPKIVLRVSPGAFRPRPKVDSAVVAIRLRPTPAVALRDEARFRDVVRRAFGQRRKTLRAALAALATAPDFQKAGIDSSRRGETLSLAEFATLANVLAERAA